MTIEEAIKPMTAELERLRNELRTSETRREAAEWALKDTDATMRAEAAEAEVERLKSGSEILERQLKGRGWKIDELVGETEELEARAKRLEEALRAYEDATKSNIDGRDLLEELCPSGWHHCDITVRINGANKHFEGDWLKGIWYARKIARAALSPTEETT